MTKDMLRLGITLLLVCGVAGLGLALVYDTTRPIIEQRAIDDAERAAKAAIPGADVIAIEVKDGVSYFIGRKGSKVVGAAMTVKKLGYNKSNPIEMVVGIDASEKVTSVSITSNQETPGIGSRVSDSVYLAKFVGVSPDSVDGVSGATYSSRAVQAGVEDALEFLGNIISPKEAAKPLDISLIADGTYKGQDKGFSGPIEVEVQIAGGKIVRVTILSHKETAIISDDAIEGIPLAIVDEQKLEVDTVAGATYASKGIIGAVKNALADAPTK